MEGSLYHANELSTHSFLVTGGAGFIGSHIVSYLLNHGSRKVRVLDNLSTGSKENLRDHLSDPRLEYMEGDIRDAEVCKKAVEGIEFVSHQAALGSVPRSIADPVTSHQVNVDGFINMLDASRLAGVRRFVYAASSSTYGDHPGLPKVEDRIGKPLSPYAVTKYVNELYASVYSMVYGFHSIGLRYFNVFGPRQNPNGPYAAVIPLFIQSVLRGEAAYINGDGTTSRDFTYVENAVQANIRGMLVPDHGTHEVFNIAYGASCTLNDLWGTICSDCGVNLSPIYREERKGDVKHSLADISKARQMIGYDPLYDMRSGLRKTIQWYKDNL
jgi:UDP-N-acetylglucosamine 4-epimerase